MVMRARQFDLEEAMTVQSTVSEPLGNTARLQQRIDTTFKRDRLTAIIFVLALWSVIFFVLLQVHTYIGGGMIELVCWIAAFLLVLFNTASITAMIRHYSQDKNYIYSLDIRHL